MRSLRKLRNMFRYLRSTISAESRHVGSDRYKWTSLRQLQDYAPSGSWAVRRQLDERRAMRRSEIPSIVPILVLGNWYSSKSKMLVRGEVATIGDLIQRIIEDHLTRNLSQRRFQVPRKTL